MHRIDIVLETVVHVFHFQSLPGPEPIGEQQGGAIMFRTDNLFLPKHAGLMLPRPVLLNRLAEEIDDRLGDVGEFNLQRDPECFVCTLS